MAPLALQKTNLNRQARAPYTWLPHLIILMTSVTLLIGFIALHYLEARLIAAKGENLALAAADIADKLDLLLFERYADIQILSRLPVFQGNDTQAKNDLLDMFRQFYPMYQWLGVTDARGRILVSTDPGRVGQDRSDQEWFQHVRDRGELHVRDAQVSEDSGGVWAVGFSAPVMDRQGKFLGVISTRVGLPALEDIFARTIREFHPQQGSSDSIEYEFLTRDGDLIVDSILRQQGKVNLLNLALPSALFTGSAQPGYVEEQHLRRHVPVVTGYAQTEGYGTFTGLHWRILVRMDRSTILMPIRTVLRMLGLAGIVVVLPLLGVLLWTTGRLRAEWRQSQEECARATAAESALQLRDRAIAASSNGIFITDPKQAGSPIIFANSAFERLTGYAVKDILGYTYRFLQGPDTDPKAFVEIRRALRENRECRVVMKNYGKDGSARWNDVMIAPIHSPMGEVTHFVGVLTDITDRKHAEEVLKRLRVQNEMILNSAGEGIYGMDRNGNTTFVNPTAAKMLGWEVHELLGRPIHKVAHHSKEDGSHYPEESCPILSSAREGGVHRAADEVFWRKDGRSFPVEYITNPIHEGGSIIGAVVTFTDITERKKAEEIRSRLLEQVISAQEEERGRIARELHDETGQSLTALLVGLKTLEAAHSLQEAKGLAESLRAVASVALHEVGRLAWGLRPSVLDDLGLLATLERYVAEYAESYALAVDLKTKGFGAARLPFFIETTLYRIIQEALTNIVKHAAAHSVLIIVEQDDFSVQMVVEDDGEGFDVEAALRTPGTSKGLGLHGMQERATLLSGTVTIRSKPGQGTAIKVRIPLAKETHAEDSRRHCG